MTTKTNSPVSATPRSAVTPAPETVLPATATYREAYEMLSSIAERLRASGTTADIDSLAADLRRARAAHRVCRTRLAAIRAEIDQEIAVLDEEAATHA